MTTIVCVVSSKLESFHRNLDVLKIDTSHTEWLTPIIMYVHASNFFHRQTVYRNLYCRRSEKLTGTEMRSLPPVIYKEILDPLAAMFNNYRLHLNWEDQYTKNQRTLNQTTPTLRGTLLMDMCNFISSKWHTMNYGVYSKISASFFILLV